MRCPRRLRGRNGQLVIPFLFVLPTLFLFVFLLMETTRISREKIRRQFALDASSSAEISLYADLLNRLAYINGPFPDRVFKELGVSAVRYYQDYAIGLFPASFGRVTEDQPRWVFRWGPGRAFLNSDTPPGRMGIFFINQESVSPRMAVFSKVYFLLGDLATSHIKVFDGATARHALLRKSMWLNIGTRPDCTGPPDCADEAADCFTDLPVQLHYLDGYEDNDDDERIRYPPPGLFQLATVKKSKLLELKDGLLIRQSWPPGKNFFGVDFDELKPYVRATVSVDGGRVWSDPTPKFHTALTP